MSIDRWWLVVGHKKINTIYVSHLNYSVEEVETLGCEDHHMTRI
jgi:hypothetical protein